MASEITEFSNKVYFIVYIVLKFETIIIWIVLLLCFCLKSSVYKAHKAL